MRIAVFGLADRMVDVLNLIILIDFVRSRKLDVKPIVAGQDRAFSVFTDRIGFDQRNETKRICSVFIDETLRAASEMYEEAVASAERDEA